MAAVGSGEFTDLSREEQATHDWRLDRFEELGFDQDQRHKLESEGASWHEAKKLLDRGCPHPLVVRVLS